jgi:hypothetical protein
MQLDFKYTQAILSLLWMGRKSKQLGLVCCTIWYCNVSDFETKEIKKFHSFQIKKVDVFD